MDKRYAKQVARAILYGYAEDELYAYKLFTDGVYRILLTQFESVVLTTNISHWVRVLELTE